MGFEVENNKRHQELWDQPAPQQSVPQKSTASKNNVTTHSNMQAKKTNSAALVIVLTAVFIIIGFLLSGVLVAVQKNRSAKPSEPIALSTRLILAKDFIPMPDGREIEKCEIQGLSNLVIDVSGKAKTEKRDYTTGSVFAFSLFDEANTVTFTEIDTGKVYMFERPSK